MLRLTNVGVRYGATEALAGVDLELAAAGSLAVLGPSGSGKSTLLRAIAGLEPLSAGRIEWQGSDLAGVPPHERGFGLMFQDYALFPHRDVRDNVAFGLEMRGSARREIARRVAEMLELVGLAGYERRSITRLSGGEQQRVALARALAPTPRLLMLDEPLGALDQALRARLLEELAGLLTELGLPIIYVTHNQQEALAVGRRVALLNAGRLEAMMPAAELWRAPPSEFAARFLGLTNISDFEISGPGIARTAWGPVPAPPTTGIAADRRRRLLIRPDGLSADAAGPIHGVVEAITFRGDHTSLRVRVADAGAPPLEMRLAGAPTHEPGDAIRLRVDPDAVVLLPRPGPGLDHVSPSG